MAARIAQGKPDVKRRSTFFRAGDFDATADNGRQTALAIRCLRPAISRLPSVVRGHAAAFPQRA
jgi:hypothetical protein